MPPAGEAIRPYGPRGVVDVTLISAGMSGRGRFSMQIDFAAKSCRIRQPI